MSNQSNVHCHLTYKQGGNPIVRQPETIIGRDAALRLIEEIAARFVANGCRAVKYRAGVRIYDCKDIALSDQSFEYEDCKDAGCIFVPDGSEYGRWGKAERQKYLTVLKERGILP